MARTIHESRTPRRNREALVGRLAIDEDHLVADHELDTVDQAGVVDLDLGRDPGLAEHDLLVLPAP